MNTPINDFAKAITSCDIRKVKQLISQGEDVNHKGYIILTTNLACDNGNGNAAGNRRKYLIILNELLKAGADIDDVAPERHELGDVLLQGDGGTCLHEAIALIDLTMVKYLCAKGCDINIKNVAGDYTPVDYAEHLKNMIGDSDLDEAFNEIIKYLEGRAKVKQPINSDDVV